MNLWDATCRSRDAEPRISRMRLQMQANCDICKRTEILCDECQPKFLRYRSVLIANLPLAKAKFSETDKREERYVRRYRFPTKPKEKGRLDKSQNLYNTVIDPYFKDRSRILLEGQSLFFAGTNSLGKTVAATYLGLRMIQEDIPVYYCWFPGLHDLAIRSKAGAPDDRMEAKALLDEIQSIEFLIVDELGKETTSSDLVKYLAESFLKAREEACLPTLLITNTPFEALRTEPKQGHGGYGPSFWAMLQERYRIFQFHERDDYATNLRLQNEIEWPF